MSPQSALLDDQQRVALGVAEPEHGGNWVAHPRDLGVNVDAACLELRMGGIDIVRGQADAGLDPAALVPRPRRGKRDARRALRRIDLDPAILAAAEVDVGALLGGFRG